MHEIAFILILCFVNFGGIWAFDTLVREQYQAHREEWVEFGSPSGISYSPPGSLQWRNSGKQIKLALRWTFRPPEWAQESRRARLAVTMMRASFSCIILWIALIIARSTGSV